MTQKRLQIHSENILPIIKKWLYTDKDIFLRELVSNACDACEKLKQLHRKGVWSGELGPFEIEVLIDKQARTISVVDNGIGMDAEEVERYIAQVAFSGAEEFVSKYQTEEEGDRMIGHFGLGFYSSYMVAERVEVITRSFKEEAQAVRWECAGGAEYGLEVGDRASRGTSVILHVAKEEEEYLDEERLRAILQRYCAFLPYPIFLNSKRVNAEEPLWIRSTSEVTDKEFLSFYEKLYPMDEEPLLWVPLSVDYPFHLRGILYFPRLQRDFDRTKSGIKLYSNRVFVADDCKELMPEYLTVLRGAIDSPDLPLNVSRSTLQTDRTVRQLAAHVSKKVADRLVALFRTDRERFIACWRDLEVVLKLGALSDEKFYERVKECLVWKNLQGTWMTLEEYLGRLSPSKERRVFYSDNERHTPLVLQLYRERGIDVLYTAGPLDSHFVSFLESKHPGVSFQRIDGAVDEALLDKSREKGLLDAEGRTESSRIAEFVRDLLDVEGVEVQAKSLASDSVPAFVVLEERLRRIRDTLLASDPSRTDLLKERCTFVVNTNSPLIGAIRQLHGKKPELARDLMRQTYEMALLSQREMKPQALDAFVERNQRVLEQLALSF